METTTDTTEKTPAAAERPAVESKPLPTTERDFRTQLSRKATPGVRIGLAVGALVLLVAGIFLVRYLGSYESTDDAQVDGHVNSISARVSGHVVKLNVQDNQFVPAGTVLVEIDPADYQVALDRAKADFEDAKAAATAAGVDVPITSVNTNSQLSSTQAGADSARAGIQLAKQQAEAAKAQLQEAEANNVKAQNDLGRYKQLVDKQEVSQQQYDQAVAAARPMQRALQAARANASAALQQITEAEGKLTQAEAEWHNANTAPQQLTSMRAKAASALAEAQRKAAERRASAIEFAVHQDRGAGCRCRERSECRSWAECGPGQELMKMIPLDDIWITANFKESQLKRYAGWAKSHHRR